MPSATLTLMKAIRVHTHRTYYTHDPWSYDYLKPLDIVQVAHGVSMAVSSPSALGLDQP